MVAVEVGYCLGSWKTATDRPVRALNATVCEQGEIAPCFPRYPTTPVTSKFLDVFCESGTLGRVRYHEPLPHTRTHPCGALSRMIYFDRANEHAGLFCGAWPSRL
jgi:hypothetical protein